MSQDSIYDDGTYLAKNPTWHAQDSHWKASQIAKLLRDNNIVPSDICEVGCGAGEVLSCLASEYGDRVRLVGYEVSPQAFEICRAKETANVRFFLRDLLEEEGTTAFEVLMAIDVLEHIEDYFGFLRKLRERATYKVFHIPLELSAQMVLRGSPILRSRSLLGHIHYFTKDTALATLEDAGYEVLDYRYTAGSLDLPKRGLKADLLRLPRRLCFSLDEDLTVRTLGGFSLLVLTR